MRNYKVSLYFCLLLLFILPVLSFSQNFKGSVLNAAKEPIAGGTVYIEENKQGLICNAEGEFQTTLKDGNYHCVFSCLGFEPQQKEVFIKKDALPVYLEVVLKEKTFDLKEVVVDNSGEDPAYEIMRKAIAKAPFYLNQVKEYTSEAYVKGSGKATNIPKMMEKMGGEEVKILKDKLFLQESYSEVKFTAPDRYEQTVKAFSSSMPNDSLPQDAFGVATGSLYTPMVGPYFSPLNPKSFSYYKFRYEGYNEENGVIINKIKVTPKLKDGKFVEGYLYIADDYWNIRHAELVVHAPMTTYHYEINYDEVLENVFLTTSFTNKAEVNAFGLKLSLEYLSSIKYTDVQLNDSLIALEAAKNPVKKKEKKSLEIKWDEKYKRKADSLATKRDTMYWADIRTIKLSEEEIQSYVRKDTLQAKMDSLKQADLYPKFKWSDVLMGGRIGGDSSKITFKYGGIVGAVPEYNFVDGLWLGQCVELGLKRKENSWWKIKPMVYWTLSRKTLLWDLDIELTYAPLKSGKFSLSAGSVSEDYNDDKGMLRIENAIYSGFMGINKAKLYQNNYFRIENELDLANGLQSKIFVEAAERKLLDNHTTYSFFGDKKDAEPNTPPYAGNLNTQYDALLKYGFNLKYTPEYYYEILKGKKRYLRSRFPTFMLAFQNGVPTWLENSVFYRLDLGIEQNIKIGLFDHFSYYVSGGKFFNDNKFNYIDYKHFDAADQLITGKRFETSYSLLPYYTYSTPDKWLQAFATYNSQYLALKRLPFLQGKFFSESLHGKYLYTPQKQHYSEWGYSLGLPGLGSVGVFVSFDSFDYNSWGISISLPLLQRVGYKK